MGYSGFLPYHLIRYDKDGNYIDPEDTLFDKMQNMYNNGNLDVNCFKCKHLNEDEVSCKAFKNVIPQAILGGSIKHDEPFRGDGGVQFEPIE
tara:strand:+ start:73 stop:348 length:276 start_codon:yes stop_codon:yes gene_type:complete